jgi:hypothetical protein
MNSGRLRGCFEKALPPFEVEESGTEATFPASRTAVDISLFALQGRETEEWADDGTKILDKVDRTYPGLLEAPDSMPLTFYSGIRGEKCVTVATLVHVLDLINRVLHKYHEAPISIQLEYPSKNITKTNTRDRCDLHYACVGSETKTIAVIKLKAPGTIRPDQFDNAIWNLKDPKGDGLLGVEDLSGGDKSMFEFGSAALITQCTRYAVRFETGYVILSDWERYILIIFNRHDPSVNPQEGEPLSAGESCKITIIRRRNYDKLMKALLGFLDYAIRDVSSHSPRQEKEVGYQLLQENA